MMMMIMMMMMMMIMMMTMTMMNIVIVIIMILLLLFYSIGTPSALEILEPLALTSCRPRIGPRIAKIGTPNQMLLSQDQVLFLLCLFLSMVSSQSIGARSVCKSVPSPAQERSAKI